MNPNTPRETLAPQLYGVHITMIVIAAITVIGRLTVRTTLVRGTFGSDDITICFALAFAIAFVVVNLLQINYGLGQHTYDLPKTTDSTKALQLFFFGEILYPLTVGATKLAVLLLYLRIVPSRGYRYVIYGSITFVILTTLAFDIAFILQCTPVDYAWFKEQEGECHQQTVIFLCNAAFDIFQDFFIYVLPIPVLYRLHMPLKQRLALIAIFVIGGFVVITGVLRLTSLSSAVETQDPTCEYDRTCAVANANNSGDNIPAAQWSVVEVCVGIICASLVHFKPLIERFAPRWLHSGGYSRQSNSQNQIQSLRPPSNARYVQTSQSFEVESEIPSSDPAYNQVYSVKVQAPNYPMHNVDVGSS